MSRLRFLKGDRKGSATIEFAFASLLMFGTIMVALDFGFFVQQKLKLGNVVEQAAILAYNRQVGADTSSIKTYVETYSGLNTAPQAKISCNGTDATTDLCSLNRCSCITAAGAFTIAAGCNVPCGTGAVSGNYLRIEASATYKSVIVPDKYLNNATMKQVAVVRLQ